MQTLVQIHTRAAAIGLTPCLHAIRLVRMATGSLHTQPGLLVKGFVFMEMQRQMNLLHMTIRMGRMMIIRVKNEFGVYRNFLYRNIYVAVCGALCSEKEK